MVSAQVPCIHCGGVTLVTDRTQNGRYLVEQRRCASCKQTFEHFATHKGDDAEPKACTVNGCPDRPKCSVKYDAEKCVIYRAVVVRKMEVCK